MDRGAWWAIVHGVAKSQTQLSMHTHTNIQSITVPSRTEGFSPPDNMYKNIYSSLIHNSPSLEMTQTFSNKNG